MLGLAGGPMRVAVLGLDLLPDVHVGPGRQRIFKQAYQSTRTTLKYALPCRPRAPTWRPRTA